MCEQCALAVEWHYPKLSDEERGELLMSATCFPFGSPETIEAQLVELKEKTDGTLHGAIVWAHQELDRQMTEFRESHNAGNHGVDGPVD